MPSFPPGPRVLSLTLLRYALDSFALCQSCERRYGDPFSFPVLPKPALVTGNPEAIRELFAADPDLFEPWGQDLIGPFFGSNSVLLTSGTRHKRDRKLMMPPFHGARMRLYGQAMQDIALRHASSWKPGQPFIMQRVTQAVSLEVIMQTIFGLEEEGLKREMAAALVESNDAVTPFILLFPALRRRFLGFGPWHRFTTAIAKSNALLYGLLERRRADPTERQDILSMLLSARDEAGEPMTDLELRDQLGTLLTAGHETTAIGLAWALYWIHRQPEVYRKVREELAPLGDMPAPDALAALPYLSAVVDETLRIHPIVANVNRQLLRPWSFMGYDLPKGASVSAAIVLTHANETLYPEPDRFRPERFLERKFTPSEYMPFGGGSRRCLGAAFSLYEMKIVLGTLLARHRLALVDSRPIKPARRGITLGPKGGVRMVYEGLV